MYRLRERIHSDKLAKRFTTKPLANPIIHTTHVGKYLVCLYRCL